MIDRGNAMSMDDTTFINEIVRPTLQYNEHLIIYNRETGEYRQAVPTCTGTEAYELPCNGTAIAIIICDVLQETKRGEYEYYRYEGTFRTFYDFLDAAAQEPIYYQHSMVSINGVFRYFEYSRCDSENR